MIIQAHLNYFEILECGLYRNGNPHPVGLDAAETFDLIYDWVRGKPLEDTIPWDPRGARSGVANCYCHDVYRDESHEDFLLVLWKSEAGDAGTVWGAQANATTGNGVVVEYAKKIEGKPVIWGRPCYYWIIPNLKTVISIKVDHSVCDSHMFQDWVSKCIINRIQHPNKTRSETEKGQARFSFSDGSDPSESRYGYRFNARLMNANTRSAELSELAQKITHIVRRETIRLQEGVDERDGWMRIFDNIPFLPAKPKAKARHIEIRAEVKPSVVEIKSIIDAFARENRKKSDWDNVGFQTDAGPVVWVDRYRLHGSVAFEKEISTVFSAADMHCQLMRQRDRLLAPLFGGNSTMIQEDCVAVGAGA